MATDLANLAIKIDSTDAAKATKDLDGLTAAGKKTNVTVEQAERYMRKASVQLGSMGKEAADAGRQMKSASQAASDMANEAMRAAERTKDVAGMSKAAAFASRNLAYQLTDVAQGFALGQKPMQIFMQQGFQIADALAMMSSEAKKAGSSLTGSLISSFKGFAGTAAAAGAALASVAGFLKVVQDETNKTSDVTVSFKDTALGVYDGIVAFLRDKLAPAYEWVANAASTAWQYVSDVSLKAANFMVGVMVAVPKTIVAAFQTFPAAIAELFINMANRAIKAVEDLVNKAIAGLNKFSSMVSSIVGVSIGEIGKVDFGQIENRFAGAGSRAGAAMGDAMSEVFKDRWGAGIAYFKPFIVARARMEKDAKEIGKKAGSALAKGLSEAANDNDWMYDAFIQLDKDARKLAETLGKDLAGSLDEILQRLGRMRDFDLAVELNKASKAAEAAADKLQYTNDQLERTANLLRQIGGLGGVLGGALSFLAGDNSFGGGKIGSALDILLSTRTGKTVEIDGKEIAVTIGDELRDIFSQNGAFGQTFSALLSKAGQGAAIGSAADGILGALGIKSSNTGAQIGGAAGMAAFGPIGAIGGAILGGAIGGLLKTNRTARANITSVDSVSLGGKKKGSYDTANDLAGAVIGGLQQIADVLGAEIGTFNTTIGVRGKDFRVNTDGTSLKKKNGAVDFNQDSAAAVAFAIADAVKDGAFTGLSAGIEKLITGSGDLDTQLQKALSFKGVFDYLEQQADPAAYALKDLGKELDYLKGVFDEAGASADDLAKLEEYSAARRKEVLEQFNQEAEQLAKDRAALEIQILTGQGRIMEAVAAARQLELSAMDASLQPLQEQIYAMQDAAQQRELEIQLLEALGLAEEALDERRADYLATLPENLRAIQMQIYAAQDATTAAQEAAAAQEEYNSALASARSDLVSAYNREASVLQATADRFRNFADSMRDFRKSLYGADSGLSNTTALLAELMKVGALAASGNEAGLSGLQGAGNDYLSSLKNTASTAQEYARGVALVANYADQAANAAGARASGAEAQIRIMERQLEKLGALDDKQLTFNEALQAVKDLLESPVVPDEPTPVALPEDYVATTYDTGQAQVDALDNINRDQNRRLDELNQRIADQNAVIASMAGNMASMAGIIKRVERQGRFATVEEA